MTNSWMITALEQCGYVCRFSRKLGDWRITVYEGREIVFDRHGHSEAQVVRRAYYHLLHPEPDHVAINYPGIRARVEAACQAAHQIVASWKDGS